MCPRSPKRKSEAPRSMITRGSRPLSKRSPSDGVLISVVTVVLNGRDKIEKTIGSVSSQDYKRVEYIVIDGGSTDGTLDILKKHEIQINRWISEPDKGISDAFNKGIHLAKGDLIGILNAGDWYEPDTLSSIAEAFRSHPDVDVFCGSIQLWEADSPALLCYSDPQLLDEETSVYHPTVFIKRASYLKYGIYDEGLRYAMDYELLLRFNRQGAKFLNLEKTLANMRLEGISYKNWYAGLKEVRDARSKYFGAANVATYHSLAVLKNLLAFALKKSGLGILYRAHWSFRNKRTVARLSRG